MTSKKKTIRVLIAFGTRPEALKFVPLIEAFKKANDFECFVCVTGQHKQMVDQVVDFFNFRIDADLKLMKANQTLEYVSGRVVSRFGSQIKKFKPDVVFVQGDTATALMVGIASFYAKTPIAHLEAGLRTWNKFEPFPEEMNRTLLSHLADFHFTPTRVATKNLSGEGIPDNHIFEIGNTIVDTVRIARKKIKKTPVLFKKLDPKKRIIFVTAHRRESFGAGLEGIFNALKVIAKSYKDVQIVYPVHLNPNVQEPANRILSKCKDIHLMRPFSYEEMCWMLEKSYLILTDSGGVQEEAPSFKKPVLILRNVTERQEGIKAGVAKLVGMQTENIVKNAKKLLSSKVAYKKMQAKKNPYGDGFSCERVLNVLRKEIHSARFDRFYIEHHKKTT
jgi:UDP-N-acetylglucosamine 2-epimerase (non-hydrolysing)